MSKRRIFETHGIVFTGESGDQLIGNCPFSGRDDKFYVNGRTWLWDSKTAGLSGNVHTFMEHMAARYEGQMDMKQLKALAKNRQLPLRAFDGWGIGWDRRRSVYTIPIRSADGTVVDIRYCKLGGRVMSTPGVHVGLMGAHLLGKSPEAPVYLCEGEWDTIAMSWLLRETRRPGITVGVPGAGTFKPEWVPWLSGRTVHSLYDKDEAGEEGEHVLMKRIWSSVQRITYVHWPESLPTGFDLRDWVIAHTDEGMEAAYTKLIKLFKPIPKREILTKDSGDAATAKDRAGTAAPSQDSRPKESRWTKPPTLTEVMSTFKKWLHLESTDGILVMLACVVSQAMDGPPVWVFLVGPPGSAKTAILASLNSYAKIYATSSLTVHSLISGANWKDSMDPSLIPKLNGKVMVVKDFTSILSMRDTEKDEIFGILRDAYDGKCGKVFGNGVERHYTSRFTVLAAVTPRIYDMSSQHTSLGERFLKYAVGDNLNHVSEEDIISRAIQNINQEAEMNDEFQDVVNAFLERSVNMAHIPTIPKPIERKIVALARWGARMRGTVSRDVYKNEIITSRPSAEIGSRLGIQLAKLGKALAMVAGRTEVTDAEYRLLKKVTLDTIPQRNEDVFRNMMKLCQTPGATVTTSLLASSTRYPVATIQRLLQDMNVLDIVVRKGTMMKFEWSLSPYIRGCATTAELYQAGTEELQRKNRVFVKLARRKPA